LPLTGKPASAEIQLRDPLQRIADKPIERKKGIGFTRFTIMFS